MGNGFGTFVFAVVFMGVMLGGIIFCYWALTSKRGQRLDRKQHMKHAIRQGMRDAEIEDGLFEEAIREVADKEMRKRGRA
ncbi:hypothetical protein NG701_07395 [Pseudarthrobacter sp. HLT3-5]|uniref:hypothetical protein n=1 Tax=Pseudarthrobacter cellobiosi TaxID=2953654 RepID=UPI00208DED0B|nr:hypothetical protein [Pseudarthrobacter sp. HLT3-5]MCO4274252.1 hypothetical protein [Pseudarthrobacter sp. HLT3-5]